MLQNLSFAVVSDSTWLTEYTYLHCNYFKSIVSPETQVKLVTSIDEAIGTCSTDYLLICRAGAFPFQYSFFESLSRVDVEERLFVGNIVLASDYAYVDSSLILVNMKRWRDYGEPLYESKIRVGPEFAVSVHTSDRYRPSEIVKTSDAEIFVDNYCSMRGGAFIVEELKRSSLASSLTNYCDENDLYIFNTETPYHSLVSETYFEKNLLTKIRSKVYGIDLDDLSSAKNTTAGVVVAPAIGLKPANLAEHFKAKKIIIFSDNAAALELQKLIFSVTQKTLYVDIIDTFTETLNTPLQDGWQEDEYAIITPLRGVEVEYHLVDYFSYQMDDFIKQLEIQSSMVFDFSDIMIHPHNFYKRSYAQVSGLFEQLWSHLKSRTGPVQLFGKSPLYEDLSQGHVNTEIEQFTAQTVFDEDELELTQEMIDAAEEAEKAKPVKIDVPKTVVENPVLTLLAPTIRLAERPKEVVEPPAPIIENVQASMTQITPDIINIPEQTIEVVEMKVAELLQEKKKEDDSHEKEEKTLTRVAKDEGYEKKSKEIKVNKEKIDVLVFSKDEVYDEYEYTATLEYEYNTETGSWKFQAGMKNSDKRVEFHNGEDEKSLIKHMERKNKFNPKTAKQYFK